MSDATGKRSVDYAWESHKNRGPAANSSQATARRVKRAESRLALA
jgi:hypothetical protein